MAIRRTPTNTAQIKWMERLIGYARTAALESADHGG
jgi:hypothetical protein